MTKVAVKHLDASDALRGALTLTLYRLEAPRLAQEALFAARAAPPQGTGASQHHAPYAAVSHGGSEFLSMIQFDHVRSS